MRHFLREDVEIENKHKERCSTPFGKCKLKTQGDITTHVRRQIKLQRNAVATLNAGKDIQILDHSHCCHTFRAALENISARSHSEKLIDRSSFQGLPQGLSQ